MRKGRRFGSLGLAGVAAIVAAACDSCPGANRTVTREPVTNGQVTRLVMNVTGGFKYAYSEAGHQLEIAFLKDTPGDPNKGECYVHQLGVELTVKEGDIIVPAAPPADKKFDPAGAVITFDGATTAKPLNVARGTRPQAPFQPLSRNTDADWMDLSWVPSIQFFMPESTLAENWRSKADGRVVLTQGTLLGAKPSDDAAVNGVWDFTRKSDGAKFRQAATDRTVYTTEIPGDRIVINLANAKSGITRIEIKPTSTSRPVNLLLVGRHMEAAAQLHVGETITHFCAFYELLSKVPPMNERFLPVFAGDPSKPLQGQPTPGAYCPGE